MQTSLLGKFLSFANRLRFRNLFLLITSLFFVNLLLPDFIPFIDEIILGLMAIILSNIKKDRQLQDKGDIIEGEVVSDSDEQGN